MAGWTPAIRFKEEKDVRVRLLFAAVCMLMLPILLSPSAGNKRINSAPFATVAVAGHITPGGYYCACGSSFACICDPDEQSTQSASRQTVTDSGTATLDKQIANGSDIGAGVMLLTLALFLGLRLRF